MQLEAPYFSVVVPCYNAEETIAATVQSVLAQTDPDFELILVDDGSTDLTLEFARKLSLCDPRIRVIAQSNGGASAARNCGVSLARGQIVAFLDADDIWMPEKLARHRRLFEACEHVDIAFGRIRFLSADGTPTAVTSRLSRGKPTIQQLLAENITCTMSNVTVRKAAVDVIGDFPRQLAFDEDKAFLLRAHLLGMNFGAIDAVLTGYRASPDGLASNAEAMERDWMHFVGLARESAPEAVDDALPRARALFMRNLARRQLRLGQPGALRMLTRAVKAAPVAVMTEPRRWALTGGAAVLSEIVPRGALANALDSLPSRYEARSPK